MIFPTPIDIDRAIFEGLCDVVFSEIEPAAGIEGLDITPEVYHDNPCFKARLGCEHLRYVLTK